MSESALNNPLTPATIFLTCKTGDAFGHTPKNKLMSGHHTEPVKQATETGRMPPGADIQTAAVAIIGNGKRQTSQPRRFHAEQQGKFALRFQADDFPTINFVASLKKLTFGAAIFHATAE